MVKKISRKAAYNFLSYRVHARKLNGKLNVRFKVSVSQSKRHDTAYRQWIEMKINFEGIIEFEVITNRISQKFYSLSVLFVYTGIR